MFIFVNSLLAHPIYALSFYGSKMILDRPYHIGRIPHFKWIKFVMGPVQMIFDKSKL
jgi:hypothetical protein